MHLANHLCDLPRLDTERPILQVLEESSMVLHGHWCQVEDFKKRINAYAPDYLFMEEAGKGMAPDYDHAQLVTRAHQRH